MNVFCWMLGHKWVNGVVTRDVTNQECARCLSASRDVETNIGDWLFSGEYLRELNAKSKARAQSMYDAHVERLLAERRGG